MPPAHTHPPGHDPDNVVPLRTLSQREPTSRPTGDTDPMDEIEVILVAHSLSVGQMMKVLARTFADILVQCVPPDDHGRAQEYFIGYLQSSRDHMLNHAGDGSSNEGKTPA
jgi:hypothetical protein